MTRSLSKIQYFPCTVIPKGDGGVAEYTVSPEDIKKIIHHSRGETYINELLKGIGPYKRGWGSMGGDGKEIYRRRKERWISG